MNLPSKSLSLETPSTIKELSLFPLKNSSSKEGLFQFIFIRAEIRRPATAAGLGGVPEAGDGDHAGHGLDVPDAGGDRLLPLLLRPAGGGGGGALLAVAGGALLLLNCAANLPENTEYEQTVEMSTEFHESLHYICFVHNAHCFH